MLVLSAAISAELSYELRVVRLRSLLRVDRLLLQALRIGDAHADEPEHAAGLLLLAALLAEALRRGVRRARAELHLRLALLEERLRRRLRRGGIRLVDLLEARENLREDRDCGTLVRDSLLKHGVRGLAVLARALDLALVLRHGLG